MGLHQTKKNPRAFAQGRKPPIKWKSNIVNGQDVWK